MTSEKPPSDRIPSDRHDEPTLGRRLDALRFVEPTPALRQRTLTAVREALDDSHSPPSWTIEALLAGVVLIVALALGTSQVDRPALPVRAPAADVLALVDMTGSTAVVRHVPFDRPAHAERSAATARASSFDPSLLDPSPR
ncbi:MAG: hypothetical protein AAGE94_12705 [Acidobacteriota bacterium]